MESSTAAIMEKALKWLKMDKNPVTHAEIQRLVDAHNFDELNKRLDERIVFGTAGLRARMQAGFSYMNDVTVIQTSQGLGAYVIEQFGRNAAVERGIVVGYDHRHNSARFARLTAAAFLTQGIKVYFYDELSHTPLVPFGIKHFGALAGVMITASHNPAMDNGYKVYWENACQIIPPHDKAIYNIIEQHLEPKCWDFLLVDDHPLAVKRLLEVREAYFAAIKQETATPSPPLGFKFVYTPMHGVGLFAMKEAVDDLGLLESIVVVKEQALPNPDFPTVSFPNPEEKGALDLAIADAGADLIPLVTASDPDADRFAAAILDFNAVDPSPTYTILTGNELGILFAAFILETYKGDRSSMAMLASTVSSQMLGYMAEAEGFIFEETLTGFKWLGNVALQLREKGINAIYAFEEAIGYMFTNVVPDKDGIAAASVFLCAAIHWANTERLTPLQKLEQLYKKYGYFESHNSYFISPSPAITRGVFERIRDLKSEDEKFPKYVGKRLVLRWRDLTTGYDSGTPDNAPNLPVSKSSDMITCWLEGEVRFSVRGSGTEPKIKMYIECKAGSREAAKKGADEVAVDLEKEWFRPFETGLKKPQ
ncbi:phosphoglucomutase-2 [Terfezia boudieri ATCC MYA-4762]|uniref:Phosphoglucomutase-2 n=1 Tax=Terfezia boudieri ATCC MYA-4762 TaxID=1051890 RepID=A0A3N4LRL6_9PEZI|nr:phosphoglucomutase-2 [Terfezia boudieri ATCC MYA-4762]